MPAYPNALIQATPRNALLGRLSDALAYTYSPERTQQAQMMAQFLGAPAISRTLDKLSYGEPLTTGAGGLGGTTRFNNDALEAAMTIAPMVGPTARAGTQAMMATGRAGERLAERYVPQVMDRGGLGAEMLSAMSNRTMSPLDVYHGTPHTLPPTARNPLGEFDASKIGTGEGAQAYGHGLYFAENPVVAKGYQEALSNPEVVLKDGTRISKPKTGSPEDVAKAWLEEAYLNGDKTPFDTAIQKVSRLRNSANSPKQFDGALNVLNEWKKSGASVDLGGNLYKIDLPDEKIAKMLDWDKPLSQQSAEIQALAKQFDYPLERSGGDFQRWASSPSGALRINLRGPKDAVGIEAQAANFFKASGIPGIKYLDEGSRNLANTWIVKHPQGGENVFSTKESAEAFLRKYPEDKSKLIEPKVTRNFVTFPGEEKSMTILERNGQKFDNSALMAKKFDVVKRDASEIFGAGAERFRYTDPTSGGMIDVLKRPDNTASVLGLEVPEAFRGKGIGESLQSQVLQDFPAMMGQVSSKAAAKTAYRLGRRPPNQPDATLDDVFKLIDENSSVNLVSPKMQQTFNPAPTSTFDNTALTGAKFTAPQDEALRLAQQRASLPPSQGGLGLPAGNTPEQRAKAMGFNTDAYHATDADIIKFDNAKLGTNTRQNTGGDQEAVESAMLGHWFSDRDLTNKDPRGYMFGDVVYPVKLRKPKKINDKEFGSISYIVKDPDQIRSRFAAFDPLRKTAAIAAAAGLAAPDLLAGQSPQQAPKFDNSALMK